MGYKKKWIPPPPTRNNLAAWKALFTNLHNNLLDAGLVQRATAGQLDISAVAALPTDGTFAGFIEYAFTDNLQATAPILLKLEFGCGVEGLNNYTFGPDERNSRRPNTPFIRANVSFKGAWSGTFGYPQSFSNTASNSTNTTVEATSGISYICASPARGFFGVAYGVGSRNNPFFAGGNSATAIGSYIGSTFSLFVQRTLDEGGAPTGDGVALYYTGYDKEYAYSAANAKDEFDGAENWYTKKTDFAYSQYLPASAGTKSRHLTSVIGGDSTIRAAGGSEALDKVFYATPKLVAHKYLYVTNASSIPEQDEVPVLVDGETLNFVSLGRGTSLAPDYACNNRATYLMLFDDL